MRQMKCVFALVLGSILGLVSCCCKAPTEAKRPAAPESPPAGTPTNNVPPKQEDLPVRKPMLE